MRHDQNLLTVFSERDISDDPLWTKVESGSTSLTRFHLSTGEKTQSKKLNLKTEILESVAWTEDAKFKVTCSSNA